MVDEDVELLLVDLLQVHVLVRRVLVLEEELKHLQMFMRTVIVGIEDGNNVVGLMVMMTMAPMMAATSSWLLMSPV